MPVAPHQSRRELVVVVMAAVPAPESLPPGAASATGPFPRQEGVYTPTSHEGAPGRGDGPEFLLGGREGSSPGGGRGPHFRVGQWRAGKGPIRRGTAAIPHAGRSWERVNRLPAPPSLSPNGWGCGRRPDEQRPPPDQGTAGGGGGSGAQPPSPPFRPPPLPSPAPMR